jgi:hypothetical protein
MKNDLNNIDTLGTLLAQIADLEKQAKAIKDDLKDSATAPGGSKVFEGDLFKATVVEANRSSVDWLALLATKLDVKADWETVAAKIGYDNKELPKAIADNTKTSAVFSVKVTSR